MVQNHQGGEAVPGIVLREHFGSQKHLYRQCCEIHVHFSTLQLMVNIVTFNTIET